jgi:hypothetical protein
MTIVKGTPVDLLIEKFVAWLQEQPEYVQVLQMPRQQRRAAQRALADRLFQHITFGGAEAEANRGRRRRTERIKTDLEKQAVRKEEARKRRVERAMQTLIDEGVVGGAGKDELTGDETDAVILPDPEGDAKADIEAADADELMFVETDDVVDVKDQLIDDEAEAELVYGKSGEEERDEDA